jgi:hypothetical protein
VLHKELAGPRQAPSLMISSSVVQASLPTRMHYLPRASRTPEATPEPSVLSVLTQKPCKESVGSLPFNPKLCVPCFSTTINGCKIFVTKGEVLFRRNLSRQLSDLMLGGVGGHGTGTCRRQ